MLADLTDFNVYDYTTVDKLLIGANSEITPAFKMAPTTPTPNRVLNIGTNTITNPNNSIRHMNQPVANSFFTFSGGTVTLPSATAGTIVVSPTITSNPTLTIGTDVYKKMLVQCDNAGNLSVSLGTDGVSEAAAGAPIVNPSRIPIGIYVIQTIGGAVQNVVDTGIIQFSGGIAGSEAGAAFFTVSTSLPYTILNTDGGSIFLIDTTSGAGTITLPASPTANLRFKIKDIGGVFSSNPVTVARAGSENIELLASNYLLQADFGEWEFVTNGTDWFIVG